MCTDWATVAQVIRADLTNQVMKAGDKNRHHHLLRVTTYSENEKIIKIKIEFLTAVMVYSVVEGKET